LPPETIELIERADLRAAFGRSPGDPVHVELDHIDVPTLGEGSAPEQSALRSMNRNRGVRGLSRGAIQCVQRASDTPDIRGRCNLPDRASASSLGALLGD
jgi:hypothetical protein